MNWFIICNVIVAINWRIGFSPAPSFWSPIFMCVFLFQMSSSIQRLMIIFLASCQNIAFVFLWSQRAEPTDIGRFLCNITNERLISKNNWLFFNLLGISLPGLTHIPVFQGGASGTRRKYTVQLIRLQMHSKQYLKKQKTCNSSWEQLCDAACS